MTTRLAASRATTPSRADTGRAIAGGRAAPDRPYGGRVAPGRAAGPRKGRLLPEGAGPFLRKRLRELAGVAVMALGMMLAAALGSYDPADPSWNTAAPADAAPVRNLLGLPGAYAADILAQTLGAAAWLIAAIVAGWGLSVARHRPGGRWALRILLGMAAVLLTAVTLSAFTQATGGLPGGSAGILLVSQLGELSLSLFGWASGWAIGAAAAVPALICLLAALGVGPGAALDAVKGAVGAVVGGRLSPARLGAGFGVGTGKGLIARMRGGLAGAAGLGARLGGGFARREPAPSGTGTTAETPARPTLRAERPGAPEPEGEDRRPRLAAVVAPKPKAAEAPKKQDKARQPTLALEERDDGAYELPPLDILQQPDPAKSVRLDEAALQQNATLLEGVLDDFGVKGEIVKVSPGPVVTLYELEPAPGTKSSRVIGLADDIARSMSAVSVRVAVVPGRNVIGIELPNHKRETVYFRELLETDAYEKSQAKLALVLGKDIGGGPVIADLARMPHLLVAGTTGSGKSVAINTMILSLLYRLPPEKCRFIMVDPKMLELSIYEGIPHLLAPVVTDPSKAVVALKWAVREMEDRYRAMSKLGVRNIDGYNARLKEARETGEVLTRRVQTGFDPDTGKPIFEEQPIDLTELPYIVVIVDEMADLMLVAGKDIEAAIQRLAQMARAAGIHIIMATQRPSVDVITGTIKANFPTRISFQVTSKIDSRTILGEQGAEQLLGQGDMLYMAGGGRITRVHGPFVRDEEVEQVVRHLKAQGEPMYVDAVTEEEEEFDPSDLDGDGGGGAGGTGDDLYDQAVALVSRERKASTSFIQRHLRIGYNSAARLIERMEKEGVVGKANHVGKREVLARDIDDHERVN